MSYTALNVDVDIGSVQYSKSTNVVCHCFYRNKNGCIYSKQIISNDRVRNFPNLVYK